MSNSTLRRLTHNEYTLRGDRGKPGGQHVNNVTTTAIAEHTETGVQVRIGCERSISRNADIALVTMAFAVDLVEALKSGHITSEDIRKMATNRSPLQENENKPKQTKE